MLRWVGYAGVGEGCDGSREGCFGVGVLGWSNAKMK